MLLGQSNLARLVVVSVAMLLVAQFFLVPPADAAFELACMDKCLKVRRCKKYGQVTVDAACDKQCKKKCYKIKA